MVVTKAANQSVERTGGSRYAQSESETHRRLPPVAQAGRSAASTSPFHALRLGVFASLRFTGVDFNAETQSRKDAERI